MKHRIRPPGSIALFLAVSAIGTGLSIAQPATGPPAAVESGHVDVESGKLYYEAAGQGPPVVMIHDGLLHSATWDGQFTAFARSHRVIRWDRRGYGRSAPPKAPFSNRDDLLAVMRAAGVERATLMGCSSGGLLAMEFALAHPEMVSSLVLVGPIISGFDFSEHMLTRGGRGMPPRGASAEQRIEFWSVKDPWIMAPESEAARGELRSLMLANPQNMAHHSRYALPPDQPTRSRLSQIDVPTLIVVGEADIPDVHTHIGVIQAGIAGSERVVLEHSGHLCHREVPEDFNRLVLEFLETDQPGTP